MIINKNENVLKVTPTVLSEYINKRISDEVERQIKSRLDPLSMYGLYVQDEVEEDKKQFDVNRIIQQISGEGHDIAYIQSYFYKNYAIKLPESRIVPFHKGVVKEYQSWKRKTLTSVYPILWIESVDYQFNNGGVLEDKKLFYCFGVDSSGFKKVIAMAEGTEEKSVLGNLLLDISNRGVKDILMVCLTDFDRHQETIREYYPETVIQGNILFELNEVMEFVPAKHVAEFRKSLTSVYKSKSHDEAMLKLESMDKRWGVEFPVQCARWRRFVTNLKTYWQLSEPLKKFMYTTKLDQRIYKKMKVLVEATDNDLDGNQLMLIFYRCQQDITSSRDRYRIYRWRSTLLTLEKAFPNRI